MSLAEDLGAARNAILAGVEWLDAMIAVDTLIITDLAEDGAEPTSQAFPLPAGSKRFVAMHVALFNAGPAHKGELSLTDFFLRMSHMNIVAFFDDVIESLPETPVAFPVWPVLNLPAHGAET